jgi:hypothetical protein
MANKSRMERKPSSRTKLFSSSSRWLSPHAASQSHSLRLTTALRPPSSASEAHTLPTNSGQRASTAASMSPTTTSQHPTLPSQPSVLSTGSDQSGRSTGSAFEDFEGKVGASEAIHFNCCGGTWVSVVKVEWSDMSEIFCVPRLPILPEIPRLPETLQMAQMSRMPRIPAMTLTQQTPLRILRRPGQLPTFLGQVENNIIFAPLPLPPLMPRPVPSAPVPGPYPVPDPDAEFTYLGGFWWV